MRNLFGTLAPGDGWIDPPKSVRLVIVEQLRDNRSFGESVITNLVGTPLNETDEQTLVRWLTSGGLKSCKVNENIEDLHWVDQTQSLMTTLNAIDVVITKTEQLDRISLVLRRNQVGVVNVRVVDTLTSTELILTLEFRPKIGWAAFAFLFSLGNERSISLSATDAVFELNTGPTTFLKLLALRFVNSVNRYLAWGLFGDYEESSDQLSFIRGHINFQKTLPNLEIGRIQFDVSFDEFSIDSEINRVICEGLRIAKQILRPSNSHQVLAWIERVLQNDFSEVGEFAWSDLRTTPGLHQERARSAWCDASLLIRSISPMPNNGVDEMFAFLIENTDAEIEDAIRYLLQNEWLPEELHFGSLSRTSRSQGVREVEGSIQFGLSTDFLAEPQSTAQADPDIIVTCQELGIGREPSLKDFIGDVKYKVLNKRSVDEPLEEPEISQRIQNCRLRRGDEQQAVFFGRLYGMHNAVVLAFREVAGGFSEPEKLVTVWKWGKVSSTTLTGEPLTRLEPTQLPEFRLYTITWPILVEPHFAELEFQRRSKELTHQAFQLVMQQISERTT